MAFRVRCPACGRLATITSSNEIDLRFKQAYCACRDPECGHTFVVNVEFSHTLSPSAHNLPDDLRAQIRTTPPQEQASLFSERRGAPGAHIPPPPRPRQEADEVEPIRFR